jgi:hypothetical protein
LSTVDVPAAVAVRLYAPRIADPSPNSKTCRLVNDPFMGESSLSDSFTSFYLQ